MCLESRIQDLHFLAMYMVSISLACWGVDLVPARIECNSLVRGDGGGGSSGGTVEDYVATAAVDRFLRHARGLGATVNETQPFRGEERQPSLAVSASNRMKTHLCPEEEGG